jgi:hypothetical protein
MVLHIELVSVEGRRLQGRAALRARAKAGARARPKDTTGKSAAAMVKVELEQVKQLNT